jgi:hypothetical protein
MPPFDFDSPDVGRIEEAVSGVVGSGGDPAMNGSGRIEGSFRERSRVGLGWESDVALAWAYA